MCLCMHVNKKQQDKDCLTQLQECSTQKHAERNIDFKDRKCMTVT